MNLTTIVGIVVGVIAVLVAMIFKGVSFSVFANPAALLIILAGTVAAVMIAFPGSDLKKIGKLFSVLFKKRKNQLTDQQALQMMGEFSAKVRKEGILSLESEIDKIEDSFTRRGMQLMIDGFHPELLRKILTDEIDEMLIRHQANASIFSQAGTYAPTLGVLGAVLGLIAALGNMSDTEALGHAIAAAFVATMLGIFTGYVLWHPIANNLKRKSRIEANVKYLIMEGIVGMSEGAHARVLAERLYSYIPERERPQKDGEFI